MGENKSSRDKNRIVLDAILISTITPEKTKLPSSKEYVLQTLTEAVMQYIGKDPKQINKIYYNELFEKEVYDQLTTELTKNGNKLNPDIKEIIDTLIKPHWINPGQDRGYYTCDVYEIFRGCNQGVGWGIRPLICMSSYFSPEYDWVMHAKKELTELPEEKQKDVQGIGKILRELWQSK